MRRTLTRLVILGALALPCLAQTRPRSPKPAPPAAPDKIAQAEALLAKQQYAEAIPLLKQATTDNANDYAAWYDLGFAEEASGDKSAAIDAYRHSVSLNGKVFESTYALAELLYQSGDTDNAGRLFRTAVLLTPQRDADKKRAAAYTYIGQIAASTDPAAATDAFNSALRLAPKDADAHLRYGEFLRTQNKTPDAAAHLVQAAKLGFGDLRRRAETEAAEMALASKDYSQAEPLLTQLAVEDPKDALPHELLARVLAAKGDNVAAVKELQTARSIDPSAASSPDSLRAEAEMLSAQQKYDEAAGIFMQLLQKSPNDPAIHAEYGSVLMQQHRFAEAQDQLAKAVQLGPADGQAWGDLAVCASANKQYPLALKALDQRAKLLPESAGTYYLRATVLDNLHQYPQAAEQYKQFLAAAGGKYPDDEWKARHRLLAIDKKR